MPPARAAMPCRRCMACRSPSRSTSTWPARRPTTASSRSRTSIAKEDSPVVANLKHAGAIIIGRTNAPAFSMRIFSDNALHGRTLNPLDPTVTPGGSSGGAGAATATGIGCIAHGNDIGGSVRIPAYCNGVVGLRTGFAPHPVLQRDRSQCRPADRRRADGGAGPAHPHRARRAAGARGDGARRPARLALERRADAGRAARAADQGRAGAGIPRLQDASRRRPPRCARPASTCRPRAMSSRRSCRPTSSAASSCGTRSSPPNRMPACGPTCRRWAIPTASPRCAPGSTSTSRSISRPIWAR